MNEWMRALWERLRSSYWFVPAILSVFAILLSLLTLAIDTHYRGLVKNQQGWLYSGGPEGARAVLAAVASSIITVAATTFSITIAVLSLAAGQFGPRLLRNFMRDTGNQVVLGTFIGTDLYCLMILRTVRGGDDDPYTPHLSVTVGVALGMLSLALLIYFIHHVADSIQVSHVLEKVGQELHESIGRLFPENISEGAEQEPLSISAEHEICSQHEGYLQAVDGAAVLRLAVEHDLLIHILSRPGDYILLGTTLFKTSETVSKSVETRLLSAFTIDRSRTPRQDAVFAFLQLAEIGVRALSPGINDPFTAMMCIDRIAGAVKQLSERSLPSPNRCGPDGKLRLIATPYTYPELVEAAFRHVRAGAVQHWQVQRLLHQRLEYLLSYSRDVRLKRALADELQSLHHDTAVHPAPPHP